ncbi:unnamed protein product [Allacma fusca]|uniref:EF-hand domain-containing protein n=1 Tax=Allacma fusca TaxID=39272 RepID=A0A8J2LJT6_9HEXA|nr:unnamed protein product [Allacma fusca]
MHMGKELELHDKVRRLCQETHFNESEVEAILKLHSNLVAEVPMDRMQFRSVLFHTLEISETFILDRIFRVVDQNGNDVIDGDEFVQCLSTMMRGSLEEHLNFCYNVYDVNGDRSLAREEIFMCLDGSFRPGRGILEKEEISDSIRDIVEIMMRKLDVDKDGQITFGDFRAAIMNDPLLVQALGQCLPPKRNSRSILFLVTKDDRNLSNIIFDSVPPPKNSPSLKGDSRVAKTPSHTNASAQSLTLRKSLQKLSNYLH